MTLRRSVISFHRDQPTSALPLRHPGQAHALILAFASGEEIRIVAWVGAAIAADGEAGVECESRRHSRSRLIQRALQTQRRSKHKVAERRIAVGLDASPQPAR